MSLSKIPRKIPGFSRTLEPEIRGHGGKNENGPEAAEFLGAHPRSDRRNQSLKYRFLMQFQEFEELIEFYQNSIKFTEGTLLLIITY